MTDGSPLVSIRRSLARVKSEITGMDNDGLSLEIQICFSITGMDVRIGVVEHSLMQVHHKTSPQSHALIRYLTVNQLNGLGVFPHFEERNVICLGRVLL